MLCHCAECHYGECRILFTVMLSVIMMSVAMLSVVLPDRVKTQGSDGYFLSYRKFLFNKLSLADQANMMQKIRSKLGNCNLSKNMKNVLFTFKFCNLFFQNVFKRTLRRI
jgi:hypothetical protein